MIDEALGFLLHRHGHGNHGACIPQATPMERSMRSMRETWGEIADPGVAAASGAWEQLNPSHRGWLVHSWTGLSSVKFVMASICPNPHPGGALQRTQRNDLEGRRGGAMRREKEKRRI
ncbi:uncharacterized protein N7459_007255 [Penicillium hispanicum]|uniref:uncharacterized protein n=1 Tax=Penicillium hispanicum TaxID=1080232 RepID=UPI00254041E1|nr:uncharacterized protein N7459_007255 [Penicillium hispanicum]KAJ5578291.1 hypothetical protein N7459_007255 [Penicillium hispanicum]